MADTRAKLISAAPSPRRDIDPAAVRARARQLRRRRLAALAGLTIVGAVAVSTFVRMPTGARVDLAQDGASRTTLERSTRRNVVGGAQPSGMGGALTCSGPSTHFYPGRSLPTPERAFAAHPAASDGRAHTAVVFENRVVFINPAQRASVTVERAPGGWRVAAANTDCELMDERNKAAAPFRESADCGDGVSGMMLYKAGYHYKSPLAGVADHIARTKQLPRGAYIAIGRRGDRTLFGHVAAGRVTGVVSVAPAPKGQAAVMSASWCQ